MKRFIGTRNRSCGCTYCGQWQRPSRWWWLAILACKIHERKCTPTTQKVER